MEFSPTHITTYFGPPWYLLMAQAAALVGGFFLLVWVASVVKRDVSIVDIFWGPAFLLAAAVYHLPTRELPRPESGTELRLVYLGLLGLWALRLALHIAWRHQGEDYRYRAMREKAGPGFVWSSLFRVFLLQAVLVIVISMPHLFIQIGETFVPSLFDYLAFVLFGIGFFFEAVGDWQLQRFKADKANQGKVMDRGLWAYSRHPNYFGEAVIWVGFFFAAADTPGCAPKVLSLFSVLLMIFLLLKVSGVTLLEKTIVHRRPEYRDYIARTPAFFPWFPKKPQGGQG